MHVKTQPREKDRFSKILTAYAWPKREQKWNFDIGCSHARLQLDGITSFSHYVWNIDKPFDRDCMFSCPIYGV